MRKTLKGAQTPLERRVQREINSMAADYDDGAAGVLADLMQGGCQSGFIGSLIYYKDTVAFYRKHRREIAGLLAEMIADVGSPGPDGLFGDKWDTRDPLAQEDLNQNLLAWFGFEETARKLAGDNGIEV